MCFNPSLRAVAAVCLSALTVLVAARPAPADTDTGTPGEAQTRPNIVLIVADDLAPSLANFYPEGRGKAFTPNLDSLAASGGVVLTNLHSPSPVCTPSRYTILSGRYASRATNDKFLRETARNDGQTAVAFNTHLTPDDDNLAKRLRDAGYATGIVGKNHVIDVPGYDRLPYRSDLDEPGVRVRLKRNAAALEAAFHAVGFDYADGLYWGNPDADGIRPLAAHNQDWITQAAVRFIADQAEREKPFFLYMATTIPHGPHQDDRSWNADPRITPEGLLDPADVPHVQPARGTIPQRLGEAGVKQWNSENVLWLDDAVGAVARQLEQSGVRGDTVLVFLSDHGTAAKGSVYRRGTQTVGLIWRDGGFAVGEATDAALMLPDLAPTILAWAGVDPSAEDRSFDGRDMTPVLNGRALSLHDHLYFELGYTRAVQRGGLKYVAVRYPGWAEALTLDERQARLDRVAGQLEKRDRPVPTTDAAAPFSHLTIVPGGADAEQIAIDKYPAYFEPDQLYDLTRDPDEQRNLADDPAYAERLIEMKRLLDQRVGALPGHFAQFGQQGSIP